MSNDKREFWISHYGTQPFIAYDSEGHAKEEVVHVIEASALTDFQSKLDAALAEIEALNTFRLSEQHSYRQTLESVEREVRLADNELRGKLDAAVLALEEISNGRHWPTRYNAEDISREGLIEIARETLAKIGEK